jgi:HD-GYP domain-containing protein (c-di-GMP phosphodiesterase class II)
MTSTRPYRAALTTEAALEELVDCAGTQFDPVLTDACVDVWSTRLLLAV